VKTRTRSPIAVDAGDDGFSVAVGAVDARMVAAMNYASVSAPFEPSKSIRNVSPLASVRSLP
jgi:hypothetical protein